jgi:hypothetical protein
MTDACLWVVFTDGRTASICSTGNGLTRLVPNGSSDPEDVSCGWRFTAELARILQQGAASGAYSGLIVVAGSDMLDELQDALGPETRTLLIGGISSGARLPGVTSPHAGVTCH